jgi:hypothetical protein
MVCLRNISVDTLHKGDTEDDDDNNTNSNNNNNNSVEVLVRANSTVRKPITETVRTTCSILNQYLKRKQNNNFIML